MDAYKYLFRQLDVKIVYNHELGYKQVFWGTNLIDSIIPDSWNNKLLFLFYRNLPEDSHFRYLNADLDALCRLLNGFPYEFESMEHVDLLLTIHGMNKEA